MSNKSNISTVLGVALATVLAAGGSAYVTDTGLKMYDQKNAIVNESEQTAITARETELPVTVETFKATSDTFTVKPVSETENKESEQKDTEKNETETETQVSEAGQSTASAEGGKAEEGTAEQSTETERSTEAVNNGTESTVSDSAQSEAVTIETAQSDGTSAGNTQSGTTTNGGSSTQNTVAEAAPQDTTAVSFDEWGGWTNTRGDYFDGKGGYYDGNGYHYVGDSINKPTETASSSSSSGSSSSGGWDSSYILYDMSERYLSASELSDWGPWELAAARNEVFARHGRIFVTDEWREYFSQKSWYTPLYDNVDDYLSDVEWANVKLIMRLEENFY